MGGEAGLVRVQRALLSVSDKTGLAAFARALASRGIELLSSGGTAKVLEEAGLKVVEVSAHTGFPEMMDGRVKTLHPKIHGGLLALRDKADHRRAMAEHAIAPIDLLVVNLYPFEAALAKGADEAEMVENIDIGGPALIRAAAKNHAYVAVAVEPGDYAEVLAALEAHDGATPLALRRRLAGKAFRRTAAYDAAIGGWFASGGDPLTERLTFAGTLKEKLRYGENPHQSAAFYVTGAARPGVATARQLQGKELSYNNINDTSAAYELVAELAPDGAPAVAIVKHANPCGAARAASLREAYLRALACDPVSAFGGIIALNGRLDAATAEEIAKIFTEVIIAPEADEEAVRILSAKKNLRLLVAGGLPRPDAEGIEMRTVAGGFLAQTSDAKRVGLEDLRVVTKRAPSDKEIADLVLAFTVAKHVKSNAIVYVKDGATVGVGAGQMSRVDSARIAALKSEDAARAAGAARPLTVGSVAASDAFFPFPDGLEAIAAAGATAVIQPGGAMRDSEVIAAADAAGLAMVLTGVRHFRH
ncbi:MAG: bifunctional phosphoribosylaminoimidazolecarboxamide formyltransferase/IMP cyclohydrolase [Alphaproteobacteria bacterium]|nr:bifunctional phosphoribosylaminoimidazolecarboxamide formyltransferase/IMP cyclohydrolase [Alphaproteobacteria bacterium]